MIATLKHKLSEKSIVTFAVCAIVVLLVAALQPVIAQPDITAQIPNQTPEPSYISPATASALSAIAQMRTSADQRASGLDVDALIAASTNKTDTDGDRLPDSAEAVLGTDFNSSDTDGDMLDDYYEARNGLDPQKLDSNDDGIADYVEIRSVPSLFIMGWEEGDVPCQPYWIPPGNDADASWNVRATKHVHSGNYSFEFSGSHHDDKNGDGKEYVYVRLFQDLNIPVTKHTKLSYWIYHDDYKPRTIAIGGTTTDGSTIRAFSKDGQYVTDQYGVRAHPAYRQDPLWNWYYVEYDLSILAGKTLENLTIGYELEDTLNQYGSGEFKAFIDELCLWSNDVDTDGFPNEWDVDNDGDGVVDSLDLSPFTRSTSKDSFHFEVTTNGNPTYLDFQVRPKNSAELNLYLKTWDWSVDAEGQIRDLDNSRDDVMITPMLELTLNKSPAARSQLGEYGITITEQRVALKTGDMFFKHVALMPESNYLFGTSHAELREEFELIDLGNNLIALKASNGKYVSADLPKFSDMRLVAVADQVGQKEKFELIELGNETVALKAWNGTYVSFSTGHLIASADQIGERERFELEGLGGKVRVPLVPVQDIGTNVAFQGRMFYPASGTPETIVTDLRLLWSVNAQTDTKGRQVALKAWNGKYVSADLAAYPDELVATADHIKAKETFELIDLGTNKVALKAWNGRYVSVRDQDPPALITDSDHIATRETFELIELEAQNTVALKAWNGMYVSADLVDFPDKLVATVDQIKAKETFELIELSEVESETATIVEYQFPFMLTGFNVEEKYGSDAGLLYSEDLNETIRAYLALRYTFLRLDNSLAGAAGALPDYNVTVNTDIRHFAHIDAALQGVSSTMIPEVLGNLPNGKTLPIACALAETAAGKGMDAFVSGSYLLDSSSYAVHLTDVPVITTKAIKLPWYNTTTEQLQDIEGITEEVASWDLSNDEKADISMLFIFLNSGEMGITRIGTEGIQSLDPEEVEALEMVAQTPEILEHASHYAMVASGFVRAIIPVIIHITHHFAHGVHTLHESRLISSLSRSLEKFAPYLEFMGKILIALAVLWILVEFVLTAWESGWTLMGTFVALMEAILEFTYLAILIAISAIPYVGWILVFLILIADLIASKYGYGLSWIIEKIIDLFLGDFRMRTELDLTMGETTTHIYENEVKGVTVGDKIEFKSRITAEIASTQYGSADDVTASYIIPRYNYSVYSTSADGSFANKVTSSYSSTGKHEEYETGVWFTPNRGWVNFPLTVWLSVDYQAFYDECIYIPGHGGRAPTPPRWDCTRETNAGTSEGEHSTIYFDVLPGSLGGFTSWYALRNRCLDTDGDGLLNSVEGHKDRDTYFKIVNERSGLCLHTGDQANTDIQLYDEQTTGVESKWRLEPIGNGTFRIVNQRMGFSPSGTPCSMCLEATGTAPGSNVQSNCCGGGENQRWILVPVEGGAYKIVNNQSGLCLDVAAPVEEPGANVQVSPYAYREEQTWSLEAVECGTDPNKWDTDADGLSDMFELYTIVAYGLSPFSSDTDGDGLNDRLEFKVGSNPRLKDTDGDKLTDFEEYRGWQVSFTYGGQLFTERVWSEVLIVDSDDDGLTDAQEYQRGLNPRSRDTNGDGISDANESVGTSVSRVLMQTGSTDTDNDGLSDDTEEMGWEITVANASGTQTIQVTSDPWLVDTEFDGLSDFEEFNLSTNPREADTDGDGLTDFLETELGAAPACYDTDGDGLDDGTEFTHGSDLGANDTDGDSLTDYEEFELGSNPNNPDTDGDGLTDSAEVAFNSSLLLPDTDDDFLLDSQEFNLSTDPRDPDTDGDELLDGYELIIKTSPTKNDTDADGVLDGEERDLRLNPLCNDTDGDQLTDLQELELGTNPLSADTDNDGVPDLEDPDSYTSHVEQVILVYDPDPDTSEFADKLAQYTTVTIVSPDELLVNYSDAPYIVLVGRPDAGEGTAGAITHELLQYSGEILTDMLESDYYRFSTAYGIWNSTQTIVMLSHPYHSDHYRVLNILKSTKVTVGPDSVTVDYPSSRDFFRVEAIKELDAFIWVYLENAVTPWIVLTRYNDSTTPVELSHAFGLGDHEESVGRYLEIEVSENVQNETGDQITHAWVHIYYTASDLDRTGDGDANDAGDIDERTLCLYWYNESSGRWIRISEELPRVSGTGVDTTNVEEYGKSYEGYVWANLSHFCLLGLAGEPVPPSARRGGGGGGAPPDSDNDGVSDVNELLQGTDPDNPDTDGDGVIDSLDLYPMDPTLPVQPTHRPSATPRSTPLVTSTPEPTPGPTATPMATPTPEAEEPGFEALLWLLAVAFAVVLGSVSRVRRRRH